MNALDLIGTALPFTLPVQILVYLPPISEPIPSRIRERREKLHPALLRFLRVSAPTTTEGIEKYLGSGMIRGIGPVYARKLVSAFGAEVFDIIEQTPDRLREITGIGPGRASRIVSGWAEQKIIREIMLFLHSHGVGSARAVRIYKTYGSDAVRVISENPYQLARDIHGVGFKTADQIASRLGIEKTASVRLRAGISYALASAMDQGHCGLPTEQLLTLAVELLEAPLPLISDALKAELATGDVVLDSVRGEPCIFLAGLYQAERSIAVRLRAISNGATPWPHIDGNAAIPWVERKTGLTLAASQCEALLLALRSKLLVITGGPGVGKTTLVNSILKVLTVKGVRILLGAPTGRAAKRMDAFAHVTDGPDLAIVVGYAGTGKSAMLGVAREAWEEAGYNVRGATLSGIAAEGLGNGSGIASRTLASLEHGWEQGRDLLSEMDVLVIDEAGMVGTRQMERVLSHAAAAGAKVVTRIMLAHTNEEVQALNAGARERMHEEGDLGDDVHLTVERGERDFAAGDRIMFLRNERSMGVRNGTLGTVTAVNETRISVQTDQGRSVDFDIKDYRDIDHGYAATLHKTQSMTVDRTHVLATRGMDRHATYVGLSRHRDGVDLHYGRDDFVDRDSLSRPLARERAKDMASDYARPEPERTYAERRGISFRERIVEVMRKVPEKMRDLFDGLDLGARGAPRADKAERGMFDGLRLPPAAASGARSGQGPERESGEARSNVPQPRRGPEDEAIGQRQYAQGDMSGYKATRAAMGSMAQSLERDPQLESVLAGRKAQLGIMMETGRPLGAELAFNHGIDIGRGLGIGL